MFFDEMMSYTYPSTMLWNLFRNNSLPNEIDALVNLPQDKSYHPEGSVFIHTCLVVDCANLIAIRENLNEYDRENLILAAMCHDLGKVTTTVVHENGRITSYNHPEEGIKPTISLLRGMNISEERINTIIPLVREHMVHIGFFTREINPKVVYKLMKRLEPSNIQMLAYLIEADMNGRGGKYYMQGLPERMKEILEVAQSLEIKHYPDPLVSGHDIMVALNIPGSILVGSIKTALYAEQQKGTFHTRDEGILYLLLHIEKLIQDCLLTNQKSAV